MGCCCCSGVDPEDPAVKAYIVTWHLQQTRGLYSARNSGCPQAVYVRDDKLQFDCCCFGGYPLTSITKIDIFATTVRICVNDGTIIGFTTSSYHVDETDEFVRRLQAAVNEAKAKSGSFNKPFII